MDASRLARLIAESVRILGFNMDFAPVVDVVDDDREQTGNGLYSRTFGRSSEDVVELAGEFLTTLQENGVIGCVKHFPGLGAAMVDSHEELPLVEIAEDELLSSDLLPYQELFANGEVRLVMAAHAAFPNSRLQERDENGKLLPSSLSQNFITQFLRDELGYDGLAITDDLEMGAIMKNYGIGTRVRDGGRGRARSFSRSVPNRRTFAKVSMLFSPRLNPARSAKNGSMTR